MMLLRWLWLSIVALLVMPNGAVANPHRTPHAVAELVAEKEGIQAGQTVQIALSLRLKPGWHTYWRNPGDSGLATRLDWTLPPGAGVSDIDWPAPERIPVGPLVSFGYEGDLLLPVSFTAPPTARPGDRLRIRARASWLVCKDVCIPESAPLDLEVPVVGPAATTPATASTPSFASHGAVQAIRLEGWLVEMQHLGREAVLKIDAPKAAGLGASAPPPIVFFPYDERVIEPARHEVYRTSEGYAIKLSIPPDVTPPARLRGLLVAQQKINGGTSIWGSSSVAAEVEIPIRAVTQLPQLQESQHISENAQALGLATKDTPPPIGLWAALALAFVGGLILNLMPCVFPVLSIKLLSVAKQGAEDSRFKHAAAYSAGVILSFLALAAVLLVLRQAGHAIGWGFQLQEPGVVLVLMMLFFVMGLNLLGAVEFAGVTPRFLAEWRSSNPAIDALAAGVLAVVAATPCTAPFMGAALGFALTQSTGVSLAVFTSLGLGMALPYAMLTLMPGWSARLPRPGTWMVRLKQGLAFPMFLTVVWLVWVFGQQTSVDAMGRVLLLLVGIAWVTWMLTPAAPQEAFHPLRKLLLTGVLAGLVVWSWPPSSKSTSESPNTIAASTAGAWLPFDEAVLAERLAQGDSVFVDFTAAWCVTCQVNKHLVLDSSETQRDFAQARIILMRADWTDQNPHISDALARLGRSGVPVYALFRPGRPPVLLPELLTRKIVRDALRNP